MHKSNVLQKYKIEKLLFYDEKYIEKLPISKKLSGGEKMARTEQRSAGLQRKHLLRLVVTAVCMRGVSGNDRGYCVVRHP